jgi:hypothetical protein
VMRPDPAIRHWDGPTADPLPGSGLTLVNVGGHFDGQTALHWPAGAEGRGVLCSADMPQVVADRRWVTFMYSYPNLIPLPAREVRRIADLLARYPFDRLYGGARRQRCRRPLGRSLRRAPGLTTPGRSRAG